jgi:hypothetical protein
LERVGSARYCWPASTKGRSGIRPAAMDRSAAALSAQGPPRWTVPARRQAWLVKGTPARADPTGRGWMVRAACFLRLERVHEARELIYLQICRSIS